MKIIAILSGILVYTAGGGAHALSVADVPGGDFNLIIAWLDDHGRQGKQTHNTRMQGNPVDFVIATTVSCRDGMRGVVGMRQGGRGVPELPPSLGYGYGTSGVEDLIPWHASLIPVIGSLNLEKNRDR